MPTLRPMSRAVPLPKISAPARRALHGIGVTRLDQLHGRAEGDILGLHGIGPSQLAVLRAALTEHGLAMTGTAGAAPEATGRNDNRTEATVVSPADWIDSLHPERRVRQGHELLEMFTAATGERAVMWGPSMIGFGSYHYVYPTGREGDAMIMGFSPRATAMTLYGLQESDGADELLARMGPHRTGKSCVYVTDLDKIDRDVLRELIAQSWRHNSTHH